MGNLGGSLYNGRGMKAERAGLGRRSSRSCSASTCVGIVAPADRLSPLLQWLLPVLRTVLLPTERVGELSDHLTVEGTLPGLGGRAQPLGRVSTTKQTPWDISHLPLLLFPFTNAGLVHSRRKIAWNGDMHPELGKHTIGGQDI